MSDIPAVIEYDFVDDRDHRVTLTLAGLLPIKSSSRTQLPEWQPEELRITYRYRDRQWYRPDAAMLFGHTVIGNTGIAEVIDENDGRWPWVSALIDKYQPKDTAKTGTALTTSTNSPNWVVVKPEATT